MSDGDQSLTKVGFAKTFVLPALSVFLIPIISLLFFLHAQSRYNAEIREAILQQIETDDTLSPEDRQSAQELYTQVPFSKLLQHPEFAKTVDPNLVGQFRQFRWLIWLSIGSIVASIAVFLLGGLCVMLSMRSQKAQYLSLSTGWHVLRVYAALQAIAQGIMAVALSYWMTALWFEVFIIKLIGIVAIIAVAAVGALIMAIFKSPKQDFEVEGELIDKDQAAPLWNDLQRICTKLQTAPPDQIIGGIDDNFFVTEQPVVVDGKTYRGRTLYVSLSLLKQLKGDEAAAVLAHEMAHFSGQDTTFSKKISPLLIRYQNYLEALHGGGITKPIFYFMLCFRGLFELSLGKLSREREFRADRLASETTSAEAMAGALLRIVAYSNYRNSIEQNLFEQEQALEAADISDQIEAGFHDFAVAFAATDDIGDFATTHPFDSHPPLHDRLDAVSFSLTDDSAREVLSNHGDGAWFNLIDGADAVERQQWDDYEEKFRNFHKEVLAYRYLPASDAEREYVREFFPEVAFEGKQGPVVMDCEQIAFEQWPSAIRFDEIKNMVVEDNVLEIRFERDDQSSVQRVKLAKLADKGSAALQAVNLYYGRYLSAADYQSSKEEQADTETEEGT